MFKLTVLCVIFWYGAHRICGAPQTLTDTETPIIPSIDSPTMNESDYHVVLTGNNNFHAAQQIFYLAGSSLGKDIVNTTPINIGKQLPSDYTLTNGIGAHKLHREGATWYEARRICVREGGHLVVIRSESEEMIVRKMIVNASVDQAWVGFHDLFTEGDWISVLDEPLERMGWMRFSKSYLGTSQYNCARIVPEGIGIDDGTCAFTKPFICKISTD